MAKTTQELIEIYQEALDEINIAEDSGEEFDYWSIIAADAAEELKGREVTVTVKWHNGRTTDTTGTVHSIVGDTVYVNSALGLVESPVSTMSEA